MFKKSYHSDNQLEIVILGAMRGLKNDSSKRIKQALAEILDEDKAVTILFDKGIKEKANITYPEEWQDHHIEDGVFDKLDVADLIIINITPKEGKTDPTPNVFYELGLIHALGIPYLIVIKDGYELPFYIRNTRVYPVKNFGVQHLKKILRNPIYSFIDEQDPNEFTQNVISRFYNGLPIIDISATVGLATGYYMNFVRRILKDDGFISHFPKKIKSLIIVRPFDVFNTYQQDRENMENILKRNNFELILEKLAPIQTDKNGGIWFDQVNGIVIDLPRTIYPLKKSPRLLSLKERLNQNMRTFSKEIRDRILRQAADKLLDKVEDIIRFHIEKDEDLIRATLLHFSTIDNLPTKISEINDKLK